MKKVWLVKPHTFSDPIAFESEGDALEYIDMTASKDEDVCPVCCLFVPKTEKLLRGYAELRAQTGGERDE